jgi:DNA-directed RNA polymerase II subunit RPB2
MDNSTIWKLIDKYFTDNPQCLVRHHIESYNDFFKNGIFKIFKEKPPIRINTRFDKEINDYRSQCIMYFGGKDGSKIYFGKPVIYDDNNNHYMFPNEARLRNMTYGMTIHYDVEVEFIDILGKDETPKLVGMDELEEYSSSDDEDNKKKKDITNEGGKLTEEKIVEIKKSKREQAEKELKNGGSVKIPIGKKRKSLVLTPAESELMKKAIEESMIGGNIQKRTITLEKIYLGKFPIMVQSDYCVLKELPREVRHTMGECVNDLGGYFIIDGKEKTVVSQEKFADNMLYIRDVNDEHYLYSAEIRSVSENVSKPIRTLSVKIVTPSKSYSNKNIVVNIPNVRKPVPLFIVFRALGIISDKDIITTCLLDINKYDNMLDLFIPSVHDAGMIMTQRNALQYIAILTKGKTIAHTLEILSDYFLPHVGEVNFINKAYYLGYIVFRLLSVYTGLEPSTDRDNFKYKRIELVGTLMSDLFREYYTLQQRQVQLSLEEIVHYNESIYADNLYGLIDKNYKEVFRERILETGFKKAFKGNWGSQSHTKRIGIVQDLNRLSFNSALSHLRKTNLPLDASVKLVGPRVLHSTQWGMFDPIDTPDGGNIGIHKHISISAYITQGISREPFINWLREKIDMKKIEDCSPLMLANMTKILLNGLWAGSISSNPFDAVKKIKLFRRNALIPIYISVTFDIKQRTIFIYTDGGRICRPIFYRDDETSKMSFENKDIINKIKNDNFTWNDVISGFNKKIDGFKPNDYKMYELNELYEGIDIEIDPSKLERFKKNKAIIDYIDNNESEDALIAFSNEVVDNENQQYTHMEIHESFIFGMMCNLINFPENNPATRNSFSCGQSKQACSMYHTNHQVRMDKTAVVLSSGQIPLVKSRYLEYINNEENPYGENAIVAIMCYTGYNVEDAILINEGSLKRGLFRTTYYSTYESHEEKTKSGDVTIEKLFTNIENDETVNGKKQGYDYSKLDQFGIIRENTLIDDKTILIGLAANNATNKSVKIDMSKTTKKGQLGIVDKTFITESEEGKRIAKVRVREERIPNIGDKMASRSGQKGTIGLVIPEDDMPFTKDGLRPDMIINPHAIPSRMTIGHLVECIIGKAAAHYGGFSDCTAFNNKGSKVGVFGEMLPKVGFHSSGNEILYNGMTGEQIESEIFIGPNYYMRLKHMVKDKINYRALGPRTALTKQPVAGRANDGGLRIGEMERDSVISHGAAEFLRESMMERGDKYYMAVCNKTGLLAIYNPSKNIFISPMADGPIKFVGSLTENDLRIDNVTKYGRSFSVVCIPYTLKLLIQELQTINIQMRIITEDNIEQLENLSYSNNIDKLMFTKNIQPQEIVNEIKSRLRKGAKDVNEYLLTPKHIEVKEPSPDFPDTSPAYEPSLEEEIIRNEDESPPYNPFSDDNSPPYNPFSDNNIGPTTPSMSPPEDIDEINERIRQSNLQLRKDADIITEQYSVGEEVLFRGDFLPNRIWKIKSVGDRFITITTDNIQGLDDKDTIKVVTKIDIYRPNDFTYSEPNAESIRNYNEFTQKSKTMPTSGGGIQDGVPAINFAPVFKIMNGGNDFSSGEQANESISSGGETKMNTLTDLAIASSPQINIKPNNEKSGGSTIEKQEPLDFSKLIIKKV